MSQDKDDDDGVQGVTDKELKEAKSSVDKAVGKKDPIDDLPMTVSEDGVVSFGGADARGERSTKEGAEDDDDHEDPTLTEAQREALRAKRRDEKKRRREAARKREDDLRGENASLKQTVQDLAGRLQQVEQRTSSIDVSRLDEELNGAAYAVTEWKKEFQDAVAKADGVRAATAMEKINAAQREGERLYQIKQNLIQTQSQPKAAAVHPEVQRRLDKWRAKHTWYNPTSMDVDTRIALAVDQSVSADKYDPRTDEFWEELDNRLRAKLPERYRDVDDDDDSDDSPASSRNRGDRGGGDSGGSPAVRRMPASGGGSSGGNAPAGFQLSKERVAALKDAGLWNDPKKRDKAIKEFIKYDREHKNG